MVAPIGVGEPSNVDATKAVKQPGKAKQAFEALSAQLAKSRRLECASIPRSVAAHHWIGRWE